MNSQSAARRADREPERFALRLIELTRYRFPEGNRVEFVRRCEEQGIRTFLEGFPGVWEQITDNPPRDGIVPGKTYLVQRAAYSLRVAAFQETLQQEMAACGVRFLGIKGLSLSKVLSGELNGREFGDVDLLVHPKDAPRVLNHLDRAGYLRTYPAGLSSSQQKAHFRYGKAQVYSSPNSGVSLDLHWRLVSAWIGNDLLPFDDLWQRRQPLSSPGLADWDTLGPSDTLVFLALHGFQDGWPKLKQLLDLALAVERLDFDWDEVLAIAGPRAVLVERAVELAVRLLGVTHPGRLTYYYGGFDRALEAWLSMADAEKTPQSQLLRPALWSCRPEEAIGRTFRAMLTPAVDDIQSLDLPERLVGLYPLVRVFRLLRKAAERGLWPGGAVPRR